MRVPLLTRAETVVVARDGERVLVAGALSWGGGVTVLLRRSEMSAPVHLVTRFNVPNVLPTVSCLG